jgi:hypothetical protein
MLWLPYEVLTLHAIYQKQIAYNILQPDPVDLDASLVVN